MLGFKKREIEELKDNIKKGDEKSKNSLIELTIEKEEELINGAIDDFSTLNAKSIMDFKRGIRKKEDFLNDVTKYFKGKKLPEDDIKKLTSKFMKFIDGYHILEPLLNDDTISDIKILNFNNIRIKRFGNRLTSDIKFKSEEEFRAFVRLVAIKNKVNISNINAIQTFTDKDSNDKCILRINISTEYVNSTSRPYLHIRKIPKEKLDEKGIINLGLASKEQLKYLKAKLKNGQVIVFAGKGGSGKTTLMNYLIDEIDHNKSGLVIQENEELFSNTHPDLMFQHVVMNKGEGKISYSLKDLSINGLLVDLDHFIIGEIKGNEALYFLIAAYTGHKAMTSLHSNSAVEAMNKLIDYIKYASDYSREDLMKMFRNMDTTICFMKDFSIKEIAVLKGYDDAKKELCFDLTFSSIKKAN